MSHQPNSPDPLDALIAASPAEPGPDLVDRTLERLANEKLSLDETAFEAELDAMLESQDAIVGEGFALRVVAAVEESHPHEDDRVVGLPSWVVAIGSIAALMVLGMFSFIALFDLAVGQKSAAGGMVAETASSAPGIVHDQPTPVSPVGDSKERDLNLFPEDAEIFAYEEVLRMNEALEDGLLLADSDTLIALQALIN